MLTLLGVHDFDVDGVHEGVLGVHCNKQVLKLKTTVKSLNKLTLEDPLAPAGGDAVLGRDLVGLWQTEGADVLGRPQFLLQDQHGQVVVEASVHVLRMTHDGGHLDDLEWQRFLVDSQFPFATLDQDVGGGEAFDAVGCGQDGVQADDGAAAQKAAVGFSQDHGLPWDFGEVGVDGGLASWLGVLQDITVSTHQLINTPFNTYQVSDTTLVGGS